MRSLTSKLMFGLVAASGLFSMNASAAFTATLECQDWWKATVTDHPCTSTNLCWAKFKCSTTPLANTQGTGWVDEAEPIGDAGEQYFTVGCPTGKYWNVSVHQGATETPVVSCKRT